MNKTAFVIGCLGIRFARVKRRSCRRKSQEVVFV